MSNLVGNHIVGFPTRQLIYIRFTYQSEKCFYAELVSVLLKFVLCAHIKVHARVNYSFSALKYRNDKGLAPTNEPPHGKTNNPHMRKQRRRSASQ